VENSVKDNCVKICFVYVTDQRGLGLATMSAMSVGLSQPKPCHVRIFCHKFVPEPDQRLSDAARKLGMQLTFSQIEDRAVEHHKTYNHVTTPSLLKLRAVASLTSDYDRIVFLDNDVLIFRDLEIERLPFGPMPVAAVTDIDFTDTGAQRHHDWGNPRSRGADTGNYFNSGVMIFDSRNWHDDFLADYARALDGHEHGCPYKVDCTSTDQCALNVAFENQWLKLSATYNMQGSAKFTKNWDSATIRHYSGPKKYVPLSPFRNDGRDVRFLNRIFRLLGRPTSKWALIYQLLYSLNCIRNFRMNTPTRNFLYSHELRHGPRTSPERKSLEAAKAPHRATSMDGPSSVSSPS
jgi:lipopolysaccharide biosynthesis glycosyltransferase